MTNELNPVPAPTPAKPKSTLLRNILIAAVALMVIAVVGFYLLAPFFGIAIFMAASAGAWSIAVITLVLFCSAVLLFFIIPGIIIALIVLLAIIWTILAIALFPFLFPIVIPVLIILLAVAIIRKYRNQA